VDRAHLVTVPLVAITVVALQVQVTTMKALVVERQISELAQR
jgi:L-rhamnose isomerase